MTTRHTTRRGVMLAFVGVCVPVPSTHAQPCTRYWADAAGDYAYFNHYQPALAVFDDGSGPALYASGNFRHRKSGISRSIPTVGRWRGGKWELLTNGMFRPHVGQMTGLRVLDDGTGPKLYTGIQVTTFSAPEYRYEFYVWNGTSWNRTPPGMLDGAIGMASYNDGSGMAMYGIVTCPNRENCVGRWRGDHWEVIGTPDIGGVTAMCVYDSGTGPRLYVAGTFNRIDGVLARSIAMWDGASWSPVGNAVSSYVRGMVVHDDGTGPALFCVGLSTPAGYNRGVSKWDGQTWSLPGGGIPTQGTGYITALHYVGTHDDGRGTALYVGGYLSLAGGTFVNSIARWDGQAWEALGGGLYPGFGSMASFDDGHGPALYVSTQGGPIGATTNSVLSKWVGCPNCYADCNRDGRLDTIDFLCFQDQYVRGDAYANCTVDTRINVADYICFISKFAAGCP
ncbi:MAG: hypothetical protein JNM80_14200 [Phycisphaerae bacterium]|nr:hypothetical protein [Phycisphaerae bacterium]